jgi:tRNA threonylcarbamoyl adenosine modification protein YeaZ
VLLLAIDTSAAAVTAAVHDGTDVLAAGFQEGPQAHGELLAPMVAAVLEQAGAVPADLTSVAVGVGPGPYTGLRVGIVTGAVLGYALGIPVGGVCSLDALALLAVGSGAVAGPFAVVTDARRHEVYVAGYDGAGVRQSGPEVLAPADLPEQVRRGPVVGVRRYPELFPGLCGPAAVTGAALASYAAGVLAGGSELLAAEPLYLRRPDAVPSAGAKSVLQ